MLFTLYGSSGLWTYPTRFTTVADEIGATTAYMFESSAGNAYEALGTVQGIRLSYRGDTATDLQLAFSQTQVIVFDAAGATSIYRSKPFTMEVWQNSKLVGKRRNTIDLFLNSV